MPKLKKAPVDTGKALKCLREGKVPYVTKNGKQSCRAKPKMSTESRKETIRAQARKRGVRLTHMVDGKRKYKTLKQLRQELHGR
jgi:hypothetical protein